MIGHRVGERVVPVFVRDEWFQVIYRVAAETFK